MPFEGCKKLREYFNVVTDTLRDGADPEDSKPEDIIRRTDFSGVDFALVTAGNPANNNGYDAGRVNLDPQKGPIDNGYIGMFYNKDVLAANDVALPTTLEELRAACEALKAKGVTPFATGCLDLSVPYIGLIGLFAQTVYAQDPTWSAKRDAGEVSFATSAEWRKAFDLLTEIVYGYADANNTFNMDYDQSAACLATGNAAFYIQGSWALSAIRSANKDANIGICAIPVTDNADDAKLLAFPDTSMSVMKDSKHVDWALKFMDYMTTQEAGTIWSEKVAVSSAVKGVEVDWDPIASDINYYLSNNKFTPYGDRVLRTIFTDKLWEQFSTVMLGTATYDDLAKELDTFWDKALEAEKAAN